MTMIAELRSGLPDPVAEAEFYDGVPTKRLVAWFLDTALVVLLTVAVLPFTAFTGLLYLPFLYLLIEFLYRWVTLARGSATPGMRFVAIGLRDGNGERLDAGTALLHVTGYAASMAFFPVQLLSMAFMLVTPRGQGLTDLVLGTAAIRRMARD